MSMRLIALATACGALGISAPDALAQTIIAPFATGAVVDHRIRVGGETERVAGAIWGAGATVSMADWFGVRARVASGTLSGRTPGTENRSLSEAEILVVLVPDAWIALDVGPTVRALQTPIATQRWVELRAGAELGLDLLAGTLRGTIRGSIAPSVSVSGHPSPDLAVGAGTGLEYRSGRLSATLAYSLDRYDFPVAGGNRRLEQHSALLARIGWRLR